VLYIHCCSFLWRYALDFVIQSNMVFMMVFGKESQVERIERMIKVMVVGLPGKASLAVAEEVIRREDEMELFGFTLGRGSEIFEVSGAKIVQIEPRLLYEQKSAEFFSDVVAVDLTPRRETLRFLDNVRFYCKLRIPFATGEDRSYVRGKARSSVAIMPNVSSDECGLIVPLVMVAIRKLSKSKGRKKVFHPYHLVEAIAI